MFGFSSLEINNEEKILHIGNGETYLVKVNDNGFYLKDYTLKDKIFNYDGGNFSNGEVNSTYVLKYKDGKKNIFQAMED